MGVLKDPLKFIYTMKGAAWERQHYTFLPQLATRLARVKGHETDHKRRMLCFITGVCIVMGHLTPGHKDPSIIQRLKHENIVGNIFCKT